MSKEKKQESRESGSQDKSEGVVDHMIPKTRFDHVNNERKAAISDREAAQAQIDKLQQELESLKGGQSESLKDLQSRLEAQAGEFSQLQSQLQKERRNNLAHKIAQDLGVSDWVAELRGDDEESIKAHAQSILERQEALIKKLMPGIPSPLGHAAPAVDWDKLGDNDWVAKNPGKAFEMLTQANRNGSKRS